MNCESDGNNYNNYSRRVVVVVTFDVKNVFNFLRWVDVINALKNRFYVPKYLLQTIKSFMNDQWCLYVHRWTTNERNDSRFCTKRYISTLPAEHHV